MKVLFLGDIFGKPGRQAVKKYLEENKGIATLIVANGENATHGKGINATHVRELFDMGIDVITTGNHIWDQDGIDNVLNTTPNLIRPINYDDSAPGKGYAIVDRCGFKCLIVNVIGRLFMPQLVHDPFKAMHDLLQRYGLKRNVDMIFVDLHAEATSEKRAMGHFLDGKVSAVVGTHTHIPTYDACILENGTLFQTDTGMCGCYNSIIGNEKEAALKRFTHVHQKVKITPANGVGSIHGVLLEISDQTGLGKKINYVRTR